MTALWISIAAVLGIALGFVVAIIIANQKASKSKNSATKIIENAYAEAKTAKKEALLEAKEEIHQLKEKADAEISERRNEIMKAENRILQREENITKKEEAIDKKVESLEEEQKNLQEKIIQLNKEKEETIQLNNNIAKELEKVAGMTKEDAKKLLIAKFEDEAKRDAAIIIRDIEQKAKDEADKKSKEIITLAVQKYAAEQTSEVTVTVVPLPNDDMKGRIIGREGRNIRAIENATGVDLIIDDTPEAVVLSSFDPVRREVARMALEKLIMDGRIHPGRIEDIVDKAQKDVDASIKEAGENAIFDANIIGIHPELVKILGRLKYRTSYGQNVLRHSLEVCHIAGMLAAEIGADVKIAKRGGLLHDIGKALDHETEGTHIKIGVDLAKKYKENPAVVHCIEAHHGDVEFKSIEAVLVQAADAISSSRPGARRESLENYIKRLQQLEEIANAFKGVEKSYAIQAGREIRILVKPEEVDDAKLVFLAKDIAKKIEEEMDYPGQIKVNVIRESRSTEYAK